MVTENVFLKALDIMPLSVPKLAQKKRLQMWIRVLMALYFITHCCFILMILIPSKGSDIESFVWVVNMTHYCFYNILSAWEWLQSDREEYITLKDFTDLDASLDTTSRSSNFLLLLIVTSYLRAILYFYTPLSQLFNLGSIIGLTQRTFTLTQFSGLKYMISRRMHAVVCQFKDNTHDDWTIPIETARSIFALNWKAENLYNFRTGNALMREICLLFQSLLAYWRVYGLKHITNCLEWDFPIVTIFLHQFFYFLLMSVAKPSSEITNQTQNLAWEIDRKITFDGLTLEDRQRFFVYILELNHTPTEFKQLDLFTLDTSAFTQVCGFALNMLMVIIQFMK